MGAPTKAGVRGAKWGIWGANPGPAPVRQWNPAVPRSVMQRITLFVWSILALASLAQPAEGLAQQRRTEELMHKSGLWVQAGQVREQLLEGVARMRGQAPLPGRAAMSDRAVARVMAAMRVAFSPERLRAGIARELATLLTREDEDAALVWLSSDLGVRVNGLEEASGEMEGLRAYERDGPAFLATVPAARLEQCRRLATAVHAGEATASTVIDMTAAIIYGAASASRLPPPGLLDTLRAGVRAERSGLEQSLGEDAARHYAYAYRSLSDAELDLYVAFLDSPAGRRYSEASMHAVDGALTRASLDAGKRLGEDSHDSTAPS